MSKSCIILFLSTMSPYASEREFDCPNGSKVKGTQTNEAPVKYLLTKNPEISEVLCLVTDQAKGEALEWFETMIHEDHPDTNVVEIPYKPDASSDDVMITSIASHLSEGDKVYLDLTGGPRDVVINLLLLRQALEFKGIGVHDLVYGNINFGNPDGNRIEDASKLNSLFTLIYGLNVMFSSGSVELLEKYAADGDECIRRLVDAMKELSNELVLGRTTALEEKINQFNAAYSFAIKHTSSALLKTLLPTFMKKFGAVLDIPGAIGWCVANDKIMPALTIYTERIPQWILKDSGVIKINSAGMARFNERSPQNDWPGFFTNGFLRMSHLDRASDQADEWEQTIEKLDRFINRNNCWYSTAADYQKLKKVCRDYLYIKKILRNSIVHDSELNGTGGSGKACDYYSTEGEYIRLVQYLQRNGYETNVSEMSMDKIKTAINKALDNLKGLKGIR